VAIIARDAAAENIALTLMAGDAMRAANRPVPLRDGVLAVALPEYAATTGAAPVADAMRGRNVEPEGYVLPAYTAVEVAHQALANAGKSNSSAVSSLGADAFTTVIGPIGFDEGHELKQNPFALLEWQGNGFTLPRPATD
jgi:branched-chain amino acid transport system substrate-binding protein